MQALHSARRLRRIWLPPMLAALLFAQMLGLVHRIAHAQAGQPAAHAASPAAKLYDEHTDASECRLYDQLMHADLALGSSVAVAALPPIPPQAACIPAGRLAPQAAGFLARGPPARG